MKISPICLLTACKRHKFKLFGDSSQVRAIDNGITCCYWSASLSNWLRALQAHSCLFKCCERTAQTICTGYKENIVVLESRYLFDYLRHWNWFLLSLLIFNLFLYIFNSQGRVSLAGNSLRAKKSHWQVHKVTSTGPKSHTRAKMSHWSVIIVC